MNDAQEMNLLSGGRTCQESSAAKTTPSAAFLEHLPVKIVSSSRQGRNGQTLVVCLAPKEQSHGGSSMPNISEWPNAAAVCSLSQVLEKGSIPQRYFFEREGVRRDSAPSREAGKNSSSTAGASFTVGSHWDGDGYAHPTLSQSHNTGGIGASNQEIFSQRGAGLVNGYRMVAFGEYSDDGTASTMKARDYKDATDLAVMTVHGTQDTDTNVEMAHTLGRNHGQENAVFAGAMPVRRLTPVECERLQGFPDGHTEVTYRGKPAADGPRYKAIGNSMAVPVMRWIGGRIIEELSKCS